MTRLMAVLSALVRNPHLGISEKESYFEVHFLNARNEVSELERTLDMKLERVREESVAGRHYTRYLPKDADQIRKLAELYNLKLKFQQEKYKRYLDEPLFSDDDIQRAINLLGETK
ncbi:hypothetical protein NMW10_03945 [Pasteurella multocida]|uniref:hypothetical protein n=1 Tax=Pasteurella multocida TaxID=747 RepID=UPI000E042AF2|nr:hypothetical protein [Pasteurella multocida]MCL7816667.1 hypothetical protein [Pasteurella multocida]MDY0640633.1 hypothetical protein [Pasteurella multocida]SUB43305.1 Uncharacterised protein [Pasteurella multocida subsp. septica]